MINIILIILFILIVGLIVYIIKFYNNKSIIPNIIHKVLITNDKEFGKIPDNIQEAHNSWVTLNPNYKIKFYNGLACEEYLKKNFGPEYFECYNNIDAYSGKCDFFRYCVLYNEGGWYTDWKMVCLKSLNSIKKKNVKWYSFNDNVAGIFLNHIENNMQTAFLGSVKKHPILKDAIDSVMYNCKHKLYGKNVLDATATGVLGRSFQKNLPTLKKDEILIGDFNQSSHKGYTYKGDNAKVNAFYLDNEEIALHKCVTCVQDQVWEKGNHYWIMWYNRTYFKN